MTHFRTLRALALCLMVFVVLSCNHREEVLLEEKAPVIALNSTAPCGQGTFTLVNSNGDSLVPSPLAGQGNLPLGEVLVSNNAQDISFQLQAQFPWFAREVAIYRGPASQIPKTGTGDLDVSQFTLFQQLNIFQNTITVTLPVNTQPSSCDTYVIYYKLIGVSIFGGPIPNSEVQVWANGSPEGNGFVVDYCIGPCVTACSEGHRTGDQCSWGSCDTANYFSGLLNTDFNTQFPNGMVLGCQNGFSLTLTDQQAVNDFLPTQGSPRALNRSRIDPMGKVKPGSGWKFCRSVQLPDCPFTLDFEADANGNQLQEGAVINNQWAAEGIQISANSSKTSKAILFNSANPTGGDTDLGTPNQSFGGPGIGNGGASGQPYQNDKAENLILIIAENDTDTDHDGHVDRPDDDAAGGSITIRFDNPVDLSEMVLVDMDGPQPARITATNTSTGQSYTVDAMDGGDNSRVTVALNFKHVEEVTISLKGSGGLASLNYCPVFDGPLQNPCFNTTQNGYRNTLAGHLVAATLNATFDANTPGFRTSNTPLNDLVIRKGPFTGTSVRALITLANEVLGGCNTTANPGDVSTALKKLNQAFDAGNFQQVGKFLSCPSSL